MIKIHTEVHVSEMDKLKTLVQEQEELIQAMNRNLDDIQHLERKITLKLKEADCDEST